MQCVWMYWTKLCVKCTMSQYIEFWYFSMKNSVKQWFSKETKIVVVPIQGTFFWTIHSSTTHILISFQNNCFTRFLHASHMYNTSHANTIKLLNITYVSKSGYAIFVLHIFIFYLEFFIIILPDFFTLFNFFQSFSFNTNKYFSLVYKCLCMKQSNCCYYYFFYKWFN